MKVKYKISKEGFKRTTPLKMRIAGYVLATVSSVLGATAFVGQHEILGFILVIAGLLGKFLTDFSYKDFMANE